MQFNLSSLLALTLTLSLGSAAPATSTDKRWTSLQVTFEGADIDTQFVVPVVTGQVTAVGPFEVNPDLSISYISYDRFNFGCIFTAQHDNEGAANLALACTGDTCQAGPPQAVLTVECTECNGTPYCDGYPSL